MQVAGVLVAVEGSAFEKRLPDLQPAVLERLQQACMVGSQVEADDSAETAPGWQEAYFLVLLIEKVFAAVPDSLAIDDGPQGEANKKVSIYTRLHAGLPWLASPVVLRCAPAAQQSTACLH
jgi:hypothetical protein